MSTTAYRAGLPPMPAQIQRLPIGPNHFPVPWFVAWIDGQPDFRIVDAGKMTLAIRERRCWVCGERLFPRQRFAFVVGPMCAVNRISAEPPSHIDCAKFSAIACPFLSRPHMVRRESDKPEGVQNAAGFAIQRNPGVALVWITTQYSLTRAGEGVLFRMGPPARVQSYAQGRNATADELRHSIETGLPILRGAAEQDGPRAVADLERQTDAALRLLGLAGVCT